MEFGYVPPPFGRLWPAVESLLDGPVKRGGNDWAEVVECLDDGRAQLWLTTQAVENIEGTKGQKGAETPINATVTRRDGDTIEIWLCGGAVLSGALPYLETILAAAKADGATNARIIGRKGWARVLRPWGWRMRGDDLTKDLA